MSSRESLISVHVVMLAWRELTRTEDPWYCMPLDDRDGEIRQVVAELLNPADGLESPSRRSRIRRAAARHGEFRAAQQCAEAVVFDDFSALRIAMRCALRQRTSRQVARDVVRMLLPDWRVARRVARLSHAGLQGGR